MSKNITPLEFIRLVGMDIDLPDNLNVVGTLDLRGVNITSLPSNLSVSGSLHLRGTDITKLPDNLIVGGRLYIRGSNINMMSLPDNLSVNGHISTLAAPVPLWFMNTAVA